MRASRMNLVTLREDPSEAEIASHRLLMRAGFLYKSGAGLYLYAPLMKRVLDKTARVVAEEISRTGALEVTMPIMQEQSLWERSGRWAAYQATRTMLTVTDRGGQVFGLAPTAEEVVTDYAGAVVKSYKQLPVTFFQQHTKFRDEIRPRFGLMRVKEFIMMDAYSFHADDACLDRTYEAMRMAYIRTFKRLGLEAFAVEADSGAIGGSGSHEFMVAAEVGEDAILFCSHCTYAANVERAVRRRVSPSWQGATSAVTVETPGIGSIEDVQSFLRAAGHEWVTPERCLKCVLYVAKFSTGEATVAAFVPGNRQVNDVKLTNAVTRQLADRGPVLELRPMHAEEVTAATGAKPGFAGPTSKLKVHYLIVDPSVPRSLPLVVGANQTDHHLVGYQLDRDAHGVNLLSDDVVTVESGDGCPRCADGILAQKRGIEVGHIFKLGTKYSQSLGAQFTGQDQKLHPFIMGCYGIGSSRVVAAAVEQHHDQDGIRWPMSIAPYHCVVVPLGKAGDTAIEGAAQSIYDALLQAGIDVVLDDRDAKPGVKFKDWDLIGVPLRVVCGRGVAEGLVELKPRDGVASNIPLADAAPYLINHIRGALTASLSAANSAQ
jgi:prolyl-tRNA synthetase